MARGVPGEQTSTPKILRVLLESKGLTMSKRGRNSKRKAKRKSW